MDITRPRLPSQDQPVVTKKEARHIVWTLALPTLIEMVLISLVSMADMIQVGRVGPSAITSILQAYKSAYHASAGIFQALNVGTTALVARFTGMGQPDKASDTLRQTFVVTILLGLIISLFAGVAAPYILQFMGMLSRM